MEESQTRNGEIAKPEKGGRRPEGHIWSGCLENDQGNGRIKTKIKPALCLDV